MEGRKRMARIAAWSCVGTLRLGRRSAKELDYARRAYDGPPDGKNRTRRTLSVRSAPTGPGISGPEACLELARCDRIRRTVRAFLCLLLSIVRLVHCSVQPESVSNGTESATETLRNGVFLESRCPSTSVSLRITS